MAISNFQFPISKKSRRGQVMILTVTILSAVFLSASAISGLLFVYEIGQTTRIADSSKALFAADAAIDRALFSVFRCNPLSAPSGWDQTSLATFCTVTAEQSPAGGACAAAVDPSKPPPFCNSASYLALIETTCGSNLHDPTAGFGAVDCIRTNGVSGKTARAFQIDF